MNAQEYLISSGRTEGDIEPVRLRLLENDDLIRGLHAALGICTEAGEVADIFKRAIFYGKAVDATHLDEELGDLLWYMALAMRMIGVDFESTMNRNIAKLLARFPDKFTEDAALNRDVDAELAAMEHRAVDPHNMWGV
jgi:NTP pyrophosphatase (non-canonical NTP hydrolase)